MISPKDAAKYLKHYIESYRQEYQRFIASPPIGGGYPNLRISPYLFSKQIICSLTSNGAIVHVVWDPSTDQEVFQPPVIQVAVEGLTHNIRNGILPPVRSSVTELANDGTQIIVNKYQIDCEDLLKRVTLGAYSDSFPLKMPAQGADFWTPSLAVNLKFSTSDGAQERYYYYLELLPHVEKAAWDTRSIWTRVQADIRRDYSTLFTKGGRGLEYGGVRLGGGNRQEVPFHERLKTLRVASAEFRALLDTQGSERESVFHDFLNNHPILLDIYGEVTSKPKFQYPAGESPLGKSYVEPDFLVRYPGNRYRLIEIERPGKKMAVEQGQSHSELTQATFQTAEWKTYIQNHYDLLKERWPGISVSCSTAVIMSRSHQDRFSSRGQIQQQIELLRNQFRVDEILTYDDLLERANLAYIQLSTLSPS